MFPSPTSFFIPLFGLVFQCYLFLCTFFMSLILRSLASHFLSVSGSRCRRVVYQVRRERREVC